MYFNCLLKIKILFFLNVFELLIENIFMMDDQNPHEIVPTFELPQCWCPLSSLIQGVIFQHGFQLLPDILFIMLGDSESYLNRF